MLCCGTDKGMHNRAKKPNFVSRILGNLSSKNSSKLANSSTRANNSSSSQPNPPEEDQRASPSSHTSTPSSDTHGSHEVSQPQHTRHAEVPEPNIQTKSQHSMPSISQSSSSNSRQPSIKETPQPAAALLPSMVSEEPETTRATSDALALRPNTLHTLTPTDNEDRRILTRTMTIGAGPSISAPSGPVSALTHSDSRSSLVARSPNIAGNGRRPRRASVMTASEFESQSVQRMATVISQYDVDEINKFTASKGPGSGTEEKSTTRPAPILAAGGKRRGSFRLNIPTLPGSTPADDSGGMGGLSLGLSGTKTQLQERPVPVAPTVAMPLPRHKPIVLEPIAPLPDSEPIPEAATTSSKPDFLPRVESKKSSFQTLHILPFVRDFSSPAASTASNTVEAVQKVQEADTAASLAVFPAPTRDEEPEQEEIRI